MVVWIGLIGVGVIFIIVVVFLVCGVICCINVYEMFVDGVKDGF